MQAAAAADRLRRALGALSVRATKALQPMAEALGRRLRVPDEAVDTFSEEVPAFSLAYRLSDVRMLIHCLSNELMHQECHSKARSFPSPFRCPSSVVGSRES